MNLAQAIKLRRAAGIRALAPSRIPRQIQPDAIRTQYAIRLIRIVDDLRESIAPLLHVLPRIAPVERTDEWRADADDKARVRALMAQARADMDRALRQANIDELARKFAVQTTTFQRRQLASQVRAALGVDVFATDRFLPSMVEEFSRRNVGLITKASRETLDQIDIIMRQGLENATPHPRLAELIAERTNVGESRAKTIARDQIGKLYGQVNAARQQALGLRRFNWRNAGDPRVRPEHVELTKGGPYSYDDPPIEDGAPVLPGEPVNCRCYAEPVFDDLLNGTGAETTEAAPIEERAPRERSRAVGTDRIPANAGELDPDTEDPNTGYGETLTVSARELYARAGEKLFGPKPPPNPIGGRFGQGQEKVESGRRAIREGQRDPVKAVINSLGEIELSDGRHRTAAAIEAGAKLKIKFARGYVNGRE